MGSAPLDNAMKVKQLGLFGVNVDKNEHELNDNELRQAQNAIREPLGNISGLANRPGLIAFNTTTLTDPVLGGIGALIANETLSGLRFIYLGRASAEEV